VHCENPTSGVARGIFIERSSSADRNGAKHEVTGSNRPSGWPPAARGRCRLAKRPTQEQGPQPFFIVSHHHPHLCRLPYLTNNIVRVTSYARKRGQSLRASYAMNIRKVEFSTCSDLSSKSWTERTLPTCKKKYYVTVTNICDIDNHPLFLYRHNRIFEIIIFCCPYYFLVTITFF